MTLSPMSAKRAASAADGRRYYRTAHGSKVVTSPTARTRITLDWFEEPDACCDCVPDRVEDGRLYWVCSDGDHDGGSAALIEAAEVAE